MEQQATLPPPTDGQLVKESFAFTWPYLLAGFVLIGVGAYLQFVVHAWYSMIPILVAVLIIRAGNEKKIDHFRRRRGLPPRVK
jgi:hypothetical protein